MVHKSDQREENGLSGRGLNDRRLANPGGIQVDIGAFLCSFSFNVQIQELDNIANKIW
jgi:hypothetical protein